MVVAEERLRVVGGGFFFAARRACSIVPIENSLMRLDLLTEYEDVFLWIVLEVVRKKHVVAWSLSIDILSSTTDDAVF